VIGHLGPHVSALLDGQLDVAAEERAWSHVAGCPTCHAEVQRQGWVKSRLACLSSDVPPEIGDLKSALLAAGPPPSGEELLAAGRVGHLPRRRRGEARSGLALGLGTALGTGAAGAVALGMLAVMAPAADAPAPDRRVQPVVRPAETPRPTGTTPVRTGVEP
jgi:anti-sigma factor RsiW